MYDVHRAKWIWAVEPKNYTGAANTDLYVSMKDASHLTIALQTGAWAGGTAAVTLKQATAVAGTSAKALSFAKQWNDETTSGTLVETAVTSDTFTIGTANKLYVIEIDAAALDTSNGFDCVAIHIATPGTNADFYGVIYRLSGLRYPQATPPSALVD